MDLRHYYAAVQLIEDQIASNDVLVVSEATSDGGKAGVFSEVSRHIGARLVVERKARLATAEEQEQFRLHRQGAAAEPIIGTPLPSLVGIISKQAATPRTRKG
jgi:hypothetical protein